MRYHPTSTKRSIPMKLTRIAMLAVMMLVSAAAVFGQGNPYRLVDGWAQLPANIKFGAVISVDVDPKGNIWVFHRADPMILEFAPSGKLLKSLGNLTFNQAHGMTIDRDGNIWVTDGQTKDGKGQQVFKLNQERKVRDPAIWIHPMPSRWIQKGGSSLPTAVTAASRSLTRTGSSSTSGNSSAGQAASTSTKMTRFT